MAVGTEFAANNLPLRRASHVSRYDIVASYKAILESDPDLTKPVVAIKALIELLRVSESSTVFETSELVKTHSEILLNSVDNSIPIRAGTDLFQLFLVRWFKNEQDDAARVRAMTTTTTPSFDGVREHLLRNTRILAQKALDARDMVAEHGWPFIGQDETVLTHGASRAVIGTMLRAAAENHKIIARASTWAHAITTASDGPPPGTYPEDAGFRVIYVRDDSRVAESDRAVAELRSHGIPVAEIPLSRVLSVLQMTGSRRPTSVLLGAEAVTHEGGIISRMGTAQIAMLAHACGRTPVRVAVETHKFSRMSALRMDGITRTQAFLEEKWAGDETAASKGATTPTAPTTVDDDEVDYTPDTFITCLITEEGVKQPGDVMKRLLNLYGTLGM